MNITTKIQIPKNRGNVQSMTTIQLGELLLLEGFLFFYLYSV